MIYPEIRSKKAMQPLQSRRSRRSAVAHSHAKGWSTDRLVRRHPYASHALFYLTLLAIETSLLGYVLWSGTDTWPVWKIASIVLANMLFALIAGNHHFSKASKQIAADIILAAISMLTLSALTIFVASSPGGLKILAYAWLCALLVNILHYYPGRHLRTKRRY
jgi:hypothetical protein